MKRTDKDEAERTIRGLKRDIEILKASGKQLVKDNAPKEEIQKNKDMLEASEAYLRIMEKDLKKIEEVTEMEVTAEMAEKASKYKERYESRLKRLETRADDAEANIEEAKSRIKVCSDAIEKYKDSHCKPEEVKE